MLKAETTDNSLMDAPPQQPAEGKDAQELSRKEKRRQKKKQKRQNQRARAAATAQGKAALAEQDQTPPAEPAEPAEPEPEAPAAEPAAAAADEPAAAADLDASIEGLAAALVEGITADAHELVADHLGDGEAEEETSTTTTTTSSSSAVVVAAEEGAVVRRAVSMVEVVTQELVEEVTEDSKVVDKIDLPTASLDAAEAFKAMDVNGDGTVDQAEFVAFMQAHGMAHSESHVETTVNLTTKTTKTLEEHVVEERVAQDGSHVTVEQITTVASVELDNGDHDSTTTELAIEAAPPAVAEASSETKALKTIESVTETCSSTDDTTATSAVGEALPASPERSVEDAEVAALSSRMVETVTTTTVHTTSSSTSGQAAERSGRSSASSSPHPFSYNSSTYRGSSATLLLKRPVTPQNNREQLSLFMSLLCLDRYVPALLDAGYTVELLTPNSAQKAMELSEMTDYVDRFTFRRGIAAKQNVTRTKQVKAACQSVVRKLVRNVLDDDMARKAMVWVPQEANEEMVAGLQKYVRAAGSHEAERAVYASLLATQTVELDVASCVEALRQGVDLGDALVALVARALDVPAAAEGLAATVNAYLSANPETSLLLNLTGCEALEFVQSEDEPSLHEALVVLVEPLLRLRRAFVLCAGTCTVASNGKHLPCSIVQINGSGFVKVVLVHNGKEHSVDYFPGDTKVQSLSDYAQDLSTVTFAGRDEAVMYSDAGCTKAALSDDTILSRMRQRGSGFIPLYVKRQPLGEPLAVVDDMDLA